MRARHIKIIAKKAPTDDAGGRIQSVTKLGKTGGEGNARAAHKKNCKNSTN